MDLLDVLPLSAPARSDAALVEVPVRRVEGGRSFEQADCLAVEEPLEIRLVHDAARRSGGQSIAVTMRTPGEDEDLALGYLYNEGIIRGMADVAGVRTGGGTEGATGCRNVVTVTLRPGLAVDAARLERFAYTTSSCGVCGKTSLAALALVRAPALPAGRPLLDADLVTRLPGRVRAAQPVFASTGGLHAAALFGAGGTLRCIREDVGRHNALDKLIGARLRVGAVPDHDSILLVSGRASFELTQKALMAEIPVLAAIGAPSSLAVELARTHGMTLLGFVRDGRFTIYAGPDRIRP